MFLNDSNICSKIDYNLHFCTHFIRYVIRFYEMFVLLSYLKFIEDSREEHVRIISVTHDFKKIFFGFRRGRQEKEKYYYPKQD